MGEPALRERIAASGGWQVTKQLGRGQYGTAYLVSWDEEKCGEERKGQYKDGDQAVAKVVGLEFLPEKEHNFAFQEVELMRALRHPHIVALRDHFLTEASLELVIVMEFCDSGDLRGEVKRRTQAKPPNLLPEATIMTWFVQMTLALNYMHQRHILHRDLKSSNVFLTTAPSGNGDYDVRIGDFGISRVLEGTVDVAATVVGTPYYMSPEVCKAEPYGYKSDIWALGCVLYEMCMLKHAFESQSLLGLVYKIVSETYEPIPPQYSADLRTLLDDILEKSSSKRPSGQELIARAYVRRFDAPGQADKDAKEARTGKGSKETTEPKAAPPPVKSTIENLKRVEPEPVQPIIEDQPVRREWHAPPFVSTPAPQHTLPEGELRVRVLLSRVRRGLSARRQNWLQVFASFDRKGDGQLKEAEFERAVTSMALGLSDQEIREVRIFLQGASTHVPVDLFGDALHRSFPEVQHLEDWAKLLLSELAQKAMTEDDAKARDVYPGAQVRIHSLQSAMGAKLNGCEGIVETWNAATCRWNVRIAGVGVKSIRDEHLEQLNPGAFGAPKMPASSTGTDTIAIYRLLCKDGVTAVHESDFQAVVQRLLPQSEEQHKKLLWLLPKCPDGKVDVPEALSQLEKGFDQTTQTGATLAGGVGRAPVGAGGPPVPLVPGPLNPAQGGRPRNTGLRGPGGLPSPMAPNPVGQPAAPTGGTAAVQTSNTQNGGTGRAEAALLRLSQHLLGRARAPGPGVDVLRLFARSPDVTTLEEVMEAVSVLPLGISRAEVQPIFAHIRGLGAGTLPLSQLATAAEAACAMGVPAEAAGIEQIDPKRLGPALQRLGSRASQQEFRVALMQAEPYMTHNQMEWLSELTDKDGEGRLLPNTLLPRLGLTALPSRADPLSWSNVPPRPAMNPPRRTSVAHSAPQVLVVSALLWRVRQRLFMAGSKITLGSLLGLFDLADGSSRQQAEAALVSRDLLGSLVGHLRLGISVEEADELLSAIAASAGKRSGGSGTVQMALLYDMIDRAGQPEMESLVVELREAARQRLWGKGSCIMSAAGSAADDWLPEADFRKGLKVAMAEIWAVPGSLPEDDEDRLVLLAEKDAEGRVLWRPFVQAFCSWPDLDQVSEVTEDVPPSPAVRAKARSPSPAAATTSTTAAATQQSWRSQKAAQKEGRGVISAAGKAGPANPPLSPQNQKRGFCCFRRRSL